jgi:hypothetical protein
MLEEMQRFGEEVVPLLDQAGIWTHPATPHEMKNGY